MKSCTHTPEPSPAGTHARDKTQRDLEAIAANDLAAEPSDIREAHIRKIIRPKSKHLYSSYHLLPHHYPCPLSAFTNGFCQQAPPKEPPETYPALPNGFPVTTTKYAAEQKL